MLYFRLSATILKLLEDEEAEESLLEHELFFNILSEAALGPFARGEEKNMPKSSEKEKAPSVIDEDSHSSSAGAAPGLGTSLPSSGPGLTSPPYTATPVDHDYAKRKTLRQQQQQQQWQRQEEEQQADAPPASDHDYSLPCSPVWLSSRNERSRDSVVVMLSDSNSTQDPFTDAASSQDSSHKVHSGKGSASSSENTTPMKEGQPRGEDAALGAGVSGGPLGLEPAEEKSLEDRAAGLLQEDKCIREVLETMSMTLAEIPAPKPPADPGPQPPAVPATPPRGAPPLQASPQVPAGEGKKKAEPASEPPPDLPKCLPAGRAEQRRLLVEMCVRALFLCLGRYPQHYKSLYRLAFLYANSKTHQNLQWARDVLLGSGVPWQQLKHMPAQGLFCERNKTNLFNGIWRIPVDEIDRPGSFASHMNRSIVLLLEVLSQLKDHDTLLKVSFMLQRTPDQGKKYLRDVDRQVLAKRAFFFTVKVLEDNLNKLTGVSEQPPKAPAPPMGEMTTTDVTNRPAAEDGKHPPPKKPGLTEGACPPGPEAGPREAPQGQTPPQAVETAEQQQLGAEWQERKESPGGVATRPGSEEPMELDAGLWGGAARNADPLATPRGGRGPQSPGGALGEGPRVGAEPGVARRPSRKRKLLEDVESGKTLLLDAYRVWQQGQKVMTYDLGRIEKIMSETYMLIKQVDEDAALDQAVKFCQIQMATSAQRQSSCDTPTTPKHTKEHRDVFFPTALPTPAPLSSPVGQLLPSQDSEAKPGSEPASKVQRPPPTSSYCPPTGAQDQSPLRRQQSHPAAAMAFLSQTEDHEEPLEGWATGSRKASGWLSEEPATCSAPHPAASSLSSSPDQQYPDGDQSKQLDASRIRSRIPPNMPKLLIPSSVPQFPPEITVTPPTPTLLSPKGSISEETKQKLKNVILSSQSAANVKKETLCQPALEVQETSSQESSLESDTDEEDDYMDI
ncbi:hypothetical protein SKAU_G00007200 [Synaphobranchus kaupii]|uniref:Calcineurin-binding protein cabin-1 MEF2-binding domain-containing protein n=1 Tax=Synaphobranchus kaupii TaxID=118154 RepID=A0A9Q1G9G7_SYNKA|nr:hypothetical protein SKAU_G00007200 [Synaphobranchus kaupii]